MWKMEKEREKSIAYGITMMTATKTTATKTASLSNAEDLEYRKNKRTSQ
jgi:hypothetical protein